MDADAGQSGLTMAIHRFPERAELLRHLIVQDQTIRSICEDYALALATLAAFEARTDAASRPEIGEYRTVIAELENELATVLAAQSKQPPQRGAASRRSGSIDGTPALGARSRCGADGQAN